MSVCVPRSHLILILFILNIPFVHAEDTKTAQELLSEGTDELNAGSLNNAISRFTKAIEIDGHLSKAFNNRGVAYAQQGSLARAIDDFTMAIAENPKDFDAYNNRGLAYAHKGDFTQAIFDYTKSIELNTFYVRAYNNREAAYFKLKDYDKAWSDVHTVEVIGGKNNPDFIADLKKASSKEK